MKSVTIVVAVYNKREIVKKCIESLLNVDYLNKKIVIVDNMSTDGSYEILKEFKNKIELHRIKGSVPKLFNWVIKRTKTDYIAFTDADCTVQKDWIKQLLKGFKEKDVIAVAGHCGTKAGGSRLQKLVGIELEHRFRTFPKYISRAPTMNMIVKTEYAKKIKFHDLLSISVFEVQWGYDLTKLGKMLYRPEAKVLHYHRSSWKGYFKQQKNYAKYLYMMFSVLGYPLRGDHLSKNTMIAQVPLLELAIALLLLSFFKIFFLIFALIPILILLTIYIANTMSFPKKQRYYLSFIPIFLFRNLAWVIGSIQGLIISIIIKTTK